MYPNEHISKQSHIEIWGVRWQAARREVTLKELPRGQS